jgi:cellulose synthase/poly-beta-1,6-N-acetylglucosamine synthase-like glycosyltransferase
MSWIFWGAFSLIGFAYFGYGAWLWIVCRWRRQAVRTGPYTPFISIVMIVHNEASTLRRKLMNLLELDYPVERKQIIVVSDGATDSSSEILHEFSSMRGVLPILKPHRCGKAAGLNDARTAAVGDIIVFTDARQEIEPQGVRLLLENFSDPEVGCASGALLLGDSDSGETDKGLSLYWRFEKLIREMESASGSVVGATGALYAVRRNLLVELPPETILDDVYIPMHVVRQGYRVVFDSRARAWDTPDQGMKREFARKVRTLGGNYQLVQLLPWLLSSANPIRFAFVSHKLMRLLVPFALAALLISSIFLPGGFYRSVLTLQVLFYSLGIAALYRPKWGAFAKIADVAFTLILLNAAAVVAMVTFLTGRRVVWIR